MGLPAQPRLARCCSLQRSVAGSSCMEEKSCDSWTARRTPGKGQRGNGDSSEYFAGMVAENCTNCVLPESSSKALIRKRTWPSGMKRTAWSAHSGDSQPFSAMTATTKPAWQSSAASLLNFESTREVSFATMARWTSIPQTSSKKNCQSTSASLPWRQLAGKGPGRQRPPPLMTTSPRASSPPAAAARDRAGSTERRGSKTTAPLGWLGAAGPTRLPAWRRPSWRLA
mmetsp:Transcript_103133/g.327924  ORF Transcript_103133/g.327924 Transcript_103133/m.327924 type:complete len:227 (-) Transcript_103133:105-785(-)